MKKFALLIGVEQYEDEHITPLKYAGADVKAVATILRTRCRFDQVRVLAEKGGAGDVDAPPTTGHALDALRDLAGELRPDDLFFFFFSGHGVEVEGQSFLLMRETRQAFPEHGSLAMSLLRRSFERLAASRRVLLMDACRNDPHTGKGNADNCMGELLSKDIRAAAKAVSAMASDAARGSTTALLAACQAGQRAYEWSAKKHGVFTHYLLEGISGPAWRNGVLEFQALAGFAQREVSRWSRSTPGIGVPQDPWFEQFGIAEPIVLAEEAAAASESDAAWKEEAEKKLKAAAAAVEKQKAEEQKRKKRQEEAERRERSVREAAEREKKEAAETAAQQAKAREAVEIIRRAAIEADRQANEAAKMRDRLSANGPKKDDPKHAAYPRGDADTYFPAASAASPLSPADAEYFRFKDLREVHTLNNNIPAALRAAKEMLRLRPNDKDARTAVESLELRQVMLSKPIWGPGPPDATTKSTPTVSPNAAAATAAAASIPAKKSANRKKKSGRGLFFITAAVFAWFLYSHYHADDLRTMKGHFEPVTAAVFAPGNRALSADAHTLKLWDLDSARQLFSTNHEVPINAIATIPGLQSFLTGDEDGQVRVWDLTSGQTTDHFAPPAPTVKPSNLLGPYGWANSIFSIARANRSAIVAIAARSTLDLWDMTTDSLHKRLSEDAAGGFIWVAFSADDRQLLSLTRCDFSPGANPVPINWQRDAARLWDVDSGRELRRFGDEEPVTAAALSADHSRVVTAHAVVRGSKTDYALHVWNAETGEHIRAISTTHSSPIRAIAISPDGRYAASGAGAEPLRSSEYRAGDTDLVVYDLSNGKEVQRQQGHTRRITSVAFRGDGRVILTGSADNTVRLWKAPE